MTAAKRIDGYLEEDDEIFRVDTIPPPDGDDDAYGAATRVGPLAKAKIEEMLRAADANDGTPPPPSAVRRKVEPVAAPEVVDESAFEEEAELLLEPTSLHAAAAPASVDVRPAPKPIVAMIPPSNMPAPIDTAPPYTFAVSCEAAAPPARRPGVIREAVITLAALGVAASALVYWLF
jgi:hypothetical protein